MLKKLLEVQKEVSAVAKDSENPFFKSRYFDINKLIDTLKPVLSKHGLIVMQPLTNIDGKPAIKTIVIDSDLKEGEVHIDISSVMPIPENPDPQKMGSAITYYRRYALQSMFFLQAEDDDANHASGNASAAQKPTYASPKPQGNVGGKMIEKDDKGNYVFGKDYPKKQIKKGDIINLGNKEHNGLLTWVMENSKIQEQQDFIRNTFFKDGNPF